MEFKISKDGSVQCIYDEIIPLSEIGQLHITRASHVEPDVYGMWYADISPIGGPKLGPFGKRSNALEAETNWINCNHIRDFGR